jgi:hypothetical protein
VPALPSSILEPLWVRVAARGRAAQWRSVTSSQARTVVPSAEVVVSMAASLGPYLRIWVRSGAGTGGGCMR